MPTSPDPNLFTSMRPESHSVDALVEQRNTEYQDAWRTTGEWIAAHADALAKLGGASFCVIMIHNKAVRAQASPNNPDHMMDLLGYLELLVRHFSQVEVGNGRSTNSPKRP